MLTPKTSTLPESTVYNHPPIITNHLTPFRLPLRAGRSHLKTKASVTKSECHTPGSRSPKDLWQNPCSRQMRLAMGLNLQARQRTELHQQRSNSWRRPRSDRAVTLDPRPPTSTLRAHPTLGFPLGWLENPLTCHSFISRRDVVCPTTRGRPSKGAKGENVLWGGCGVLKSG